MVDRDNQNKSFRMKKIKYGQSKNKSFRLLLSTKA